MASRTLLRCLPATACGVLLIAVAARAQASELSWTDWPAGPIGLTSGSAIGTLPDVGVGYLGPFAYFDGDRMGPIAEDFSPAPDAGGIVMPGPVIQSAPEPVTLLLLGAGLTAIAMRQRRRQRRKQ